MRRPRVPTGLLLLVGLGLSRPATATTSDSLYASPDLRASTSPPWNPARPVSPEHGWETALRFPGRVVSLPLVGMGNLAERSLVFLEKADARGRALAMSARAQELGIVMLPASLGDDMGLGAEAGWAPRQFGYRLRVDVSATTTQYNRERILGAVGPLSVIYASAWLPREHFFGRGMQAPLSGESAYGEHTQSAKLVVSFGWQGFDTTTALRTEPPMFGDRVRLRGPRHRTWGSAWAGPRRESVTRGRDPDAPSFEIAHPAEAAGSLYRSVEQFAYGAGISHDARRGLPRWSDGWRASIEGERFDRSIRALALNDAHSGARSFTRTTGRVETGVSFGRDPRTLRLALTAVDQRLDAGGGNFLLGDMRSLGGGAGLAGFEPDRFRDMDLVLTQLAYIFPLVTNLEMELHTETGGVYPHLSRAGFATLRNSFGLALRIRTDVGIFGSLGCDWSPEQTRVGFTVGGLE